MLSESPATKEESMAIQEWSDDIIVADLADDPQFTDELSALMEKLEEKPRHVVLNFGAVGFVNSSNIAKLLRLRKAMITSENKLVLCDVNTQVWGVLLVTGLDKIFEYTNDVSTALAMLQLGGND
jgi:anti-anti-sigma factor